MGRDSPGEWVTHTVPLINIGCVHLVSCPVCGSTLVSEDTQGMARHVLWHHNKGEWPWKKM